MYWRGEVIASLCFISILSVNVSSLFCLADNPCADDGSRNYGGCQSLCLFNGDITKSTHCVCAMGTLAPDGRSCNGKFTLHSTCINNFLLHRICKFSWA